MIRLSDSKRRARLLLALLLAASLVVITLDFRSTGDGVFDRVGRGVLTVLGPVQEGLQRIFRPVGNFFAGVGRAPALRERIALLERENAGLRAREEQIADVYRENESLRRLLSLRERFDLETLPARVIGLSPSNFRRTVFVDVGSGDGVERGMPVVAGAGLVGRVLSVGASSSEVLLIVDRSSDVAGRVVRSGETGVVEGRGAGLRFEILSAYAKVAVGDRVVTAGYDRGLFPPGIPIGSVTEVPPGHGGLSRVVTVEPAVDFSRLDYVLVVTGRTGGEAQQ